MHLHDLWFFVIALLWTGYFFLEGFDFGVGILTRVLARGETERRVLLNTIGPVWDGNEVWLVTAAGATFAAFPDWYATMFSGFYLPMFVILVCLILRGVAFEYRAKRNGTAWKRNWELTIFITSLVLAFLWGVLFAAMVHGLPISADKEYVGGISELVQPYALLGGVMTVVLFTFHGAIFAALKTVGDIRGRARTLATRLGVLVFLLVAAVLTWTQVQTGNPRSLVAEVIALVALLIALAFNGRGREGWAFVFSGLTVVATFAMLFLALFPEVMPSSLDAAWSLTAGNAAASPYTLKIITWVAAFATPLILLYQGWTYWVFRKRIGTQHIPAPVHH
ncbi:cytochrome d ubiquinol oxidase subunit II [Streptomyces sp. V3I7]|uniref:cytochrome d ubiquinol oxidase subunit II n=1 Tax=Streptomyces sp. V3I7 TaxID=3042278 RepID=UPI002780EBA3|nr:cytochrome d ubiquinol oxidase subunit II [Streptomyces sp. V3I7]MDQ0994593.1 cytochrome d ubiquinol oxidase subunit II [Streptomyces sp. V3I7]